MQGYLRIDRDLWMPFGIIFFSPSWSFVTEPVVDIPLNILMLDWKRTCYLNNSKKKVMTPFSRFN